MTPEFGVIRKLWRGTDGLGRGNYVPRWRWGDPECWEREAKKFQGKKDNTTNSVCEQPPANKNKIYIYKKRRLGKIWDGKETMVPLEEEEGFGC